MKTLSTITKNNILNPIHKERPRNTLCLNEALLFKNVELMILYEVYDINESGSIIFDKDDNNKDDISQNFFKRKI